MTRQRFAFLFMNCVFLLQISFHRLYAQDPPMQWGEIPRSDLEMKSYPPDTNASALILCDYGESSIDANYILTFARHLRIKILTLKGYESGTQYIDLYTKKNYERIHDIEGTTYSLDDHNEIVKTELESKDIFQEKVNTDRTRYRFTLPSLKVGCVIEFRYKIMTEYLGLIHDWWFQYSEPALWSEYRIYSPQNVGYMTVFRKNQPFAAKDNIDVKCRYSTHSSLSYGNDELQCYEIRLAMKDVPALRDEPFTTTMNDYRSKVSVQFSGWASLTHGVKTFMTDWKKLVEELLKDDYFGDRIDDTKKVRNQTNDIIAGLSTPEQKLAAIYHWVSSSIVCSGGNGLDATHDVNDVLESKTGTSAEITFLLLSMLKSAGINADPVIVSTRDNGKIQDSYPIIDQFNYVLARGTIGNQEYFLDATDPERPMEMLPANVLNVKGLVVNSDSMKWATLTTQKRGMAAAVATLEVHEDGSLSGMIDDSYSEYGGLFARQKLMGRKSLDIAKEQFETEASGLTIDSVWVSGKDSIEEALGFHASISAPSYALKNGDMIYFNPQIIHRERENPLKTKERTFPLDYGYPRSLTSAINIVIPDSFDVLERVSDKSISLAGDAAVYTRRVDVAGRQIHLVSKFEIRRSEISADNYAALRDFYTRVVAAESEQFVLSHVKKVTVSAPADSLKQSTVPGHKASKKTQKKNGAQL